MPNVFRNDDAELVYSCCICDDEFSSMNEAIKCEESCKFMIECYEQTYKVSKKEAKEMFLMERI